MRSLNQYKIVSLILLIVSIGFVFHMVETYREQREDIVNWEINTNSNVDRLYAHVFKSAENTLRYNSESMMKLDHDAKTTAFRTNDTDQIRHLFSFYFDNYKEQIPGFDIMQIISPEGKSMYRFHRPDEYGDDLTSFRPTVKSIVKNHQPIAFFEVGVHGMYFRYIHPVFEQGVLLGFIEMGIQPHKLLEKTANILSLKSYIFKKETSENIKTEIDSFTICEACKDSFILKLSEVIDLSQNSEIVESEGKHFLVITKPLSDGTAKMTGKAVFVQDVDFLYTELYKSLVYNILVFVLSSIIIFFLLNTFIKRLLNRTREIQLLVDNTNDAMYLVRLKDGKVMDTNLRASIMLQYTKAQLLQKKVMDFVNPYRALHFHGKITSMNYATNVL